MIASVLIGMRADCGSVWRNHRQQENSLCAGATRTAGVNCAVDGTVTAQVAPVPHSIILTCDWLLYQENSTRCQSLSSLREGAINLTCTLIIHTEGC